MASKVSPSSHTPVPMRHALIPLTLAACGLAVATPSSAQEATYAGMIPTCTSQGIQGAAVMVPPGQTTEQFGETLRTGGLFPAGTQVMVLEPGQLPPLRNVEQFQRRMRMSLNLFLEQGINIQGTAYMLLEVDENGEVTAAHPNSGDAEVNRILNRTWRQARFEPYVFEGCRVKAWIQVPQTFTSDWNEHGRQVGVQTGPR